MGIFFALLPGLLCFALVGVIFIPALAVSCRRNATLLDLVGDVCIQLMLGGPLVVYALNKVGVTGGLAANPHLAVVWMVVAVIAAYVLKSAAKRTERLQAAQQSGIN